jgi:hypothetical protein
VANTERLFAAAVTVYIGDHEGNHSHDRCVSQMVFVLASTTKEAREKALVLPEITRCIGDPNFDKAEVIVAGALPKNIFNKYLRSASSPEERLLDTQEVTGSIPVPTTSQGGTL